MAITITDGYMDKGNPVVRKLSAPTDVSMRSGEGSEPTEVEIPFHRHCQKTVCSAWQGGSGLTRKILMPRNNDDTAFLPGDLSNIQSFISGTPNTWQELFTRNEDNITEDLRSILELIDKISSQVATKATWQVTFKDCGNKLVADQRINPWDGNNAHNYVFDNFGRLLNLTVKGGGVESKLTFHTLRDATLLRYELPGNKESLEVELPHHNLTINFNGVKLNEFKDICMKSGGTVDINQDFNIIPTNPSLLQPISDSHYHDEYAVIDGTYIAYRAERNAGDFRPRAFLSEKYIGNHIVQWEYHIENKSNSQNITILDPFVSVFNDESSPYFTGTDGTGRVIWLTDQRFVEPNKTNVYVFRADMKRRLATVSLAYVY